MTELIKQGKNTLPHTCHFCNSELWFIGKSHKRNYTYIESKKAPRGYYYVCDECRSKK